MSFFDEVITTVENNRFLKAVQDATGPMILPLKGLKHPLIVSKLALYLISETFSTNHILDERMTLSWCFFEYLATLDRYLNYNLFVCIDINGYIINLHSIPQSLLKSDGIRRLPAGEPEYSKSTRERKLELLAQYNALFDGKKKHAAPASPSSNSHPPITQAQAQKYKAIPHAAAIQEYALYLPSYRKIARIIRAAQQYAAAPLSERYLLAVNLWNNLFQLLYTYSAELTTIVHRIQASRRMQQSNQSWLLQSSTPLGSTGLNSSTSGFGSGSGAMTGGSGMSQPAFAAPELVKPGVASPTNAGFSSNSTNMRALYTSDRYFEKLCPLPRTQSTDNAAGRTSSTAAQSSTTPRKSLNSYKIKRDLDNPHGIDPFVQSEKTTRAYTTLSDNEKKDVLLVDPCLLWLGYLIADNVLLHIYSTIQLAVSHYDRLDRKRVPTKTHTREPSRSILKRQNSELQAAIENDKLYEEMKKHIRRYNRVPVVPILGGLSQIVSEGPPHISVYNAPYSPIMLPPTLFQPFIRCPILHPILEPILKSKTIPPVAARDSGSNAPVSPSIAVGAKGSSTSGDADARRGSASDPNYPQTELSFHPSPYFGFWVQLQEFLEREWDMNNDFTMFRILGRGAFGIVSGLQHVHTQSMYAVKEMSKQMIKASNKGYEWMVINERRMLKIMRSPFVLKLNASLHDREKLYLFTDICLGGDLSYHIKYDPLRKFPLQRARFYAAQVLLGLEHLHSQNIIYRDLKPSNILLDAEGNAVISDLGLSVRLSKNKPLRHVAGTAGYWAPEVFGKRGSYATSDYWSFGVFLFEMLCGQRPRRRNDLVYKRGKEIYRSRARMLGRNVNTNPEDEIYTDHYDVFETIEDPISAKVLYGRYDRRILDKDPTAKPRRFLLVPKHPPKEAPNPVLTPMRPMITPSAQQQGHQVHSIGAIPTSGGGAIGGSRNPSPAPHDRQVSDDDFGRTSILPEIHLDGHSRSARRCDNANPLDNDGSEEHEFHLRLPGTNNSHHDSSLNSRPGVVKSPSSKQSLVIPVNNDDDDDDDEMIPLQMNSSPMTENLSRHGRRGTSPSNSRTSMRVEMTSPQSRDGNGGASSHSTRSHQRHSQLSPRDGGHPSHVSSSGRSRGGPSGGIALATSTQVDGDDEAGTTRDPQQRPAEEVGSIHSNYLSRLQASSSSDDDHDGDDIDDDDGEGKDEMSSDRDDSSTDMLRASGGSNALALTAAKSPSTASYRKEQRRHPTGRSRSRQSRNRHPAARPSGSKSGKHSIIPIATSPTSPATANDYPLPSNRAIMRASYDEQMRAIYGRIKVRSCLISATAHTTGLEPFHALNEKRAQTARTPRSKIDPDAAVTPTEGKLNHTGQDAGKQPGTSADGGDGDAAGAAATRLGGAADADSTQVGDDTTNNPIQPSSLEPPPGTILESQLGGGSMAGRTTTTEIASLYSPRQTSIPGKYPVPPHLNLEDIDKYIVARCSTTDAFEVIEVAYPGTFFTSRQNVKDCADPSNLWTPFEHNSKIERYSREEQTVLDVDIDFNVCSAYLNVYAVDLFVRLFDPNPLTRLGAGGIDEIKNHPFFSKSYDGIDAIDWAALSAKLITPPYRPDSRVIHARSVDELMNHDAENKYKGVKITRKDEAVYDKWYYVDEIHREHEVTKLLPRVQLDFAKGKGSSGSGGGSTPGCCTIQ